LISNKVLDGEDGVEDNDSWADQVRNVPDIRVSEAINKPSWKPIPPSMILAPYVRMKARLMEGVVWSMSFTCLIGYVKVCSRGSEATPYALDHKGYYILQESINAKISPSTSRTYASAENSCIWRTGFEKRI